MKNRIEKEKGFWNAYADKYDSFVLSRMEAIYGRLLKLIKSDVNSAQEVLEVATGTAIIAMDLSSIVSNVKAIDISAEMIRVAKQKCQDKGILNVDFMQGDVCELPFDNQIFDTVIASNVLHLLYKPKDALTEMYRVLKPGGQLIVPTFCHGANLKSHLISRLMGLFGFKAVNRWSPASFHKIVEQASFQVQTQELIEGKIPLLYLKAIKNYMGIWNK